MVKPNRASTPPRRRKPWKVVLLTLATLVALCVVYLFAYDPAYRGTLVAKPARPLIFAHRGLGVHAPDNSLYAVERALEAGMDGVDVDGQLTRDSVLVIFHDLSVDRLTTSTGRVRDQTAAQMLALDLAVKFDSATTGPAPVRTFEDFVVSVMSKERGILMVELKVPSAKASGIEHEAVGVIQKYNAHGRVVLSSFNPLVLYRLKKLDSRVRTALIFMDTNWNPELIAEIKPEDRVDLPWAVRQEFIRRAIRKLVKPDMLSINHEVDEEVLDRLIAKGWPVFIWTIDEPPQILNALAKQPYGIITDQPLRAKQLRGG
ncbi:MAG: glycerophosphodiester phosphodiesterase [Gemmatimonadaceae bacterium]